MVCLITIRARINFLLQRYCEIFIFMRKISTTLTLLFCAFGFASNSLADPPYCPLKISFSAKSDFQQLIGAIEGKPSLLPYFEFIGLSNAALMNENYFGFGFHREQIKIVPDSNEITFIFGNNVSYLNHASRMGVLGIFNAKSQHNAFEWNWGDKTRALLQEWSALTNSQIVWNDCDHYGNSKNFTTNGVLNSNN